MDVKEVNHRRLVGAITAMSLSVALPGMACAQVAPTSPAQRQQLAADIAAIDADIKTGEPGETKTFMGYDLVTTESAVKVAQTNAKVGIAR